MAFVRVHRIPFSTNVERVALAAGHKGIAVEWIDHRPDDRADVVELSGQELVPVAEIDGEVVADSMRIVERLERIAPDPLLYPTGASARARVDIFVEWFDEVWKGPPNAIEAEELRPDPDFELIGALSARTSGWLGVFDDLLAEGRYLMGDAFTAADVCAFPFLKYAMLRDPDDDERFHRILEDHLALGSGFPRLREWIARVDGHPRA